MGKAERLRKSRNKKDDEFYTRLEDIEAEILEDEGYRREMEGKTVLCNCDNPEKSHFPEFFQKHFDELGLRKLIATHYNLDGKSSYKKEWEKNNNGELESKRTELGGDGDFRSPECRELLSQADVIATNGPFSLLRVLVSQLAGSGKKFVVVGNINALAYRDVFPLFMGGKMTLGNTTPREFQRPGGGKAKFGSVCWFTNIELNRQRKPLPLTARYEGNEAAYPTYDNYNAIECGRLEDIPGDFFGIIGVPLSYAEVHCPEQFDIIGAASGWTQKRMTQEWKESVGYDGSVRSNLGIRGYAILNGVQKYHRIFIRRTREGNENPERKEG